MEDQKVGIVNAVSKIATPKVAETITDHIIEVGLESVTVESLTEIKDVSESAAKRVVAAIEIHNELSKASTRKTSAPKPSTAERKMLFPFTNQDEILYWATLYTDAQKPKRKQKEEDVIKIRENVEGRKKPETPGGYLTKTELMKMGDWKRASLPCQMDDNPVGHVEKITAEVFSLDDDWEKLEKLIDIDGVGQPVASTILHLYDPERYPIFDVHALCSIRIKKKEVEYDEPFWKKYVNFCREKAECHGVCMRTLDRALYKFSKSGAATALKTITDEMFFLELKRRGYNISTDTREDTTSVELIKNG